MQNELHYLTDPCTGDICCRIRHASGLEIRVAEMPEFSTAYAQFSTRFGSIHRCFRENGKTFFLPAGTAHYMEHKLFDKEDGDVAVRFDDLGASCNAFTDFDRTVYHFHTQHSFDQCLQILLHFVMTPYFTEQTVARERGIILQEIMETLDDPSSLVFNRLLSKMYHTLPLHPDVLGTPESITQITPELLRQCHRIFYHPQNMVLCCAGNVNIKQILAVADRFVKAAPPSDAETIFLPEPETPVQNFVSRRMAVGKQQFMIGFKSQPLSGTERLRESLLCSLTLDLLTGSASPLCRKMLHDGLINDTFDTECFAGDGWFALLAEGESDDPQAVLDAICTEAERVLREGVDETLFSVLKKGAYGDSILGMNDPESVCTALTDAFMWDCESPYLRTQLLVSLTPEDVRRCLHERFRRDRTCLSVIAPEPLQF
ncbi:MAG: insulinase family protein [Oscillospiraceae bacterium]|nr:insulinase family protein [Oscillospiraceae bacterium]